MKKKVLFLCTGNSCRSQMAEGWAHELLSEAVEAYSAGLETHGLNSFAVQVMAEVGVDISAHKSQNINEFSEMTFDLIITVCGHAHETCPFFPGPVIHVGFSDPPLMAKQIAQQGGDDEAQLECYRTVRDKVKAFVQTVPELLNKK